MDEDRVSQSGLGQEWDVAGELPPCSSTMERESKRRYPTGILWAPNKVKGRLARSNSVASGLSQPDAHYDAHSVIVHTTLAHERAGHTDETRPAHFLAGSLAT